MDGNLMGGWIDELRARRIGVGVVWRVNYRMV